MTEDQLPPPVPTLRQVGPSLLIFAMFTFLGMYAIAYGLEKPDMILVGLVLEPLGTFILYMVLRNWQRIIIASRRQ